MDGTSICETIVRAGVIPGAGLAVQAVPCGEPGFPGMQGTLLTEAAETAEDASSHGHRCGTIADTPGWSIWNPWPELERWWRRRRRGFWFPTRGNRPDLTLEMLEAGVTSEEMLKWAIELRDWNRARRFWQVAIFLASLLAAGVVAGKGLEAALQTDSLLMCIPALPLQ